MTPAELAAIEALRSKSWVEDAHGEVVLLSDAEDALHAEQEARARVEADYDHLVEALAPIKALRITPHGIDAAIEMLGPTGTRGEAYVKVAAQAAAAALRALIDPATPEPVEGEPNA